MKVKKLIEALSTEEINSSKKKFEDAASNKDAWNTLKSFLLRCSVPNDIVDSMFQNFGLGFLTSWIKSMKWEEAGLGRDNEFINVLNYLEPGNAPMSNRKNFTKLYNAYVKHLLDDLPLDSIELGSGNSIALDLINCQNIYSWSDEDYRELLGIFRKQLEKVEKGELSIDDLRKIFFESNNQSRTIQYIKNYLSRQGDNVETTTTQNKFSNLSDQEAKDGLESILRREGMLDVAQGMINNIRNETSNL